MTVITIDLTLEELKKARDAWSGYRSLTSHPLSAIIAKLYAALPPVRIEPKEGGRIQYVAGPVRLIWGVRRMDDHRWAVWAEGEEVSGQHFIYAPDALSNRWTVLS